MALEREVAALREERMRLGDDMKDNGILKAKRPMSAPSNARKTWVLSSSPKMRQNAQAEHLSKPVRRKTIEPVSHNKKSNGTPPKSSTLVQKSAAVRMSQGDQAHPHAWEEFMPSDDVHKQKESENKSNENNHTQTKTLSKQKNTKKHMSSSGVQKEIKSNAKSKAQARNSFEQFVKESPHPPPDPAKQKLKMKSLSSPSTKPREKVCLFLLLSYCFILFYFYFIGCFGRYIQGQY